MYSLDINLINQCVDEMVQSFQNIISESEFMGKAMTGWQGDEADAYLDSESRFGQEINEAADAGIQVSEAIRNALQSDVMLEKMQAQQMHGLF